MIGSTLTAVWWLAAGSCSAAPRPDEEAAGSSVIRQNVEVKSAAAGPALALPRPAADRAVVDEVAASLKIMSQPQGARAASVQVSAGSKRLTRPYPAAPFLVFSPRVVTAPYDLWTFEVISGADVVWRQDGVGQVSEPIEWDGAGSEGEDAVRVGRTYFFRFSGRRGAEAFQVTSEPVTLKSLALREFLGGTRMEVANDELFETGSAKLKPESGEYLRPLADGLRRIAGEEPYKLELHAPDPDSELSARRAQALRRWLADALLINAARVEVARMSAGTRGDITSGRLPAETGERIRPE